MNKIVKFLSVFTFFLFFPVFASVTPVSVDNFRTSDAICGTFGRTISYTVGTGLNRMLHVTVSNHSTLDTVTGVTYDGIPLTMGTSTFWGGLTANWYLVNPSSGTHNVVVQSATNAGCFSVGVMSFDNVNQTTPISNEVIYPSNIVSNPSFAVVTSEGSYIVTDIVAHSGASLTPVSGTTVVSQPETSVFGVGLLSSAIAMPPSTPSYSLGVTSATQSFDAISFSVNPTVSFGGGASVVKSSEIYVPATLYSSQLFNNPVATSTFSFVSTRTDNVQKQLGLIFVTHSSTTTPTITWGGVSMTDVLDSDIVNNKITSLYIVSSPVTSSSVVVSGLDNNVFYLSQSVYSNADIHFATDKYSTSFGFSTASINIPISLSSIQKIVGVLYTENTLSDFTLLPSTSLVLSGTSTNGDFSQFTSLCTDSTNCPSGYSKTYLSRNAVILGIGMYATSSITISGTSTQFLDDLLGGFGTDSGFSSCFSDTSSILVSTGCTFKNIFFWVLRLIVPNRDDIGDMQTKIYDTVTSTSSLTSAIFLIPVTIGLWNSTSSYPTATNLSIQLPTSHGGHITGTFIPSTSSLFQSIDHFLYLFFLWLFAIMMVMYIGYKFIHILF